MLTTLSIRNIVLIEKLDIDFSKGLSVLTGETGAGKSILLDALSLALGGRGNGNLVRNGEAQGQISAIFDVSLDHPIREFLLDNGLSSGAEDQIILRRIQNADGKTRAFVNDNPTSAGLLRDLGQMLVEIHGQHDDRALIEPAVHRSLLDAFGGLEAGVATVSTAYKNWRDVNGELLRLKARIEVAAKEADYLRSSVDELGMLAPKEGEENELADQRAMMMKSEQIASDVDSARDVLSGTGSPIPLIANTLKRMERKAEDVPGLLDETIDFLGTALDNLSDAQVAIETAMREMEFDPGEQEQVEERLFALRAASRKYGIPVENLEGFADKMLHELNDLDAGEEKLAELTAKADECRTLLDRLALDLSHKRRNVAEGLCESVMAELPALKLEQAEFIVNIQSDADNISAEGIDTIEFWVRTNPGSRAGPMMKIASGGELSRFLLALKVVLADRGSTPTLVFDEIDTGVGGAVADAIGRRLLRLSEEVQVLSVTHAPQVAARANHHLLIAKGKATLDALGVTTTLEPLEGEHRLEEVARMLAGEKITNEARAAAQKLMVRGE
jgi:DNA repair protein RecN (Recombination protein N)